MIRPTGGLSSRDALPTPGIDEPAKMLDVCRCNDWIVYQLAQEYGLRSQDYICVERFRIGRGNTGLARLAQNSAAFIMAAVVMGR